MSLAVPLHLQVLCLIFSFFTDTNLTLLLAQLSK